MKNQIREDWIMRFVGILMIILRSYLKNGKLWLKSDQETSRWNLPMNNGQSYNH